MRFNANTCEYFIELLRCALHDQPAAPKPQDVSWNDLFEYAKSQSLSSMAYSAVCRSGFDIGEDLAQDWNTVSSRNLVKYFNQEHECEVLCSAFSAAGILHMPLKGSVIRKLFPAPEMREMCDLDILVKPEDLDRAHEIMLANGYEFLEEHTTSHNRDYQKLPYLNVEVHNYLLPQDIDMFSYYADFWNKANYVRDGMTCLMTWNDCYIYMMAHTCKHFFFFRGIGIRSVLDVYVMKAQLNGILNRDYIKKELEKLGILEFAVSFERLADCWFVEEKTEIPPELQDYHSRILESGTYGDNDGMKSNAMRYMQGGKSLRAAKWSVAFRKLFPPYVLMKDPYPGLKKTPFLLPLFWIYRWFRTLVVKPKNITTFFSKLKKLSLPGDNQERR